MFPIVVVKSSGPLKADEVVNNIITSNGGIKKVEEVSIGLKTYELNLCDIKTKYYESTIALLPFEEDQDIIPDDILKMAEGLVVFFDSENNTFLKEVSRFCSLKISNNIELGILITNRLQEDSNVGLTYKDVKDICKNHFDVVELDNVYQDDENKAKRDIYDDILQTFKNHVWSNVECKGSKNDRGHLDNVEEQLEAFEDLLTSIQHFKSISLTLDRDAVLDQAEKLAEHFACILEED